MVRMYYSLFAGPSLKDIWVVVSFLAIRSKAATNICVQAFTRTEVLIFLG